MKKVKKLFKILQNAQGTQQYKEIMILVRCEFVNFNIFVEIKGWFEFEIRIMNVIHLNFQIILHNFTIAFL